MSLSTRLTRAGIVLLVFSMVYAVLPSDAVSYAGTRSCTAPSGTSQVLLFTAPLVFTAGGFVLAGTAGGTVGGTEAGTSFGAGAGTGENPLFAASKLKHPIFPATYGPIHL